MKNSFGQIPCFQREKKWKDERKTRECFEAIDFDGKQQAVKESFGEFCFIFFFLNKIAEKKVFHQKDCAKYWRNWKHKNKKAGIGLLIYFRLMIKPRGRSASGWRRRRRRERRKFIKKKLLEVVGVRGEKNLLNSSPIIKYSEWF